MKAYRVEDPVGKHGLWRDFDGTINPVFKYLSVGKCKDMPMEDSDFYRYDGRQWFSATDTPEKLKEWFDITDIIEMEELGYHVYEFEISDCRVVSPFEICFTRDSIIDVKDYDPKLIWKDYAKKKRKTGKWIWNDNGIDWGIGAWECDRCGSPAEANWATTRSNNPMMYASGRYCACCGVRMEGNDEIN